MDLETARRLQNENDNRNNIVRVEGRLQVVRPPGEHGGREWEEEREGERESYGGRGAGRGSHRWEEEHEREREGTVAEADAGVGDRMRGRDAATGMT